MYLFWLYHIVDVERILNGGPWNFNGHLLILHRMHEGQDPLSVPLVFLNIWVRVHDLPFGFMSESVARLLGNFIGRFLDYDSKAVGTGFKRVMRLHVQFDTRLTLKRRKKLASKNGEFDYDRFEYEQIKIFCFLCGKLGHDEGFCPLRLTMDPKDIVFNWDISLRAPERRPLLTNSPSLNGESSKDLNVLTSVKENLNIDVLMGIDSKDCPMVQPDGKKCVRVQTSVSDVYGFLDSTDAPSSFSSTDLIQ
ncbi:hypothetical protein V6N12_030821 [Hibiscus sabdariffa]|uniref:Zinc knuckle CX2CX4HX4C domain-containing protein n=1 Tax=Hibiscus sabdariffa TaxID=183260 RepID=A0ABR2E738_9ROSI